MKKAKPLLWLRLGLSPLVDIFFLKKDHQKICLLETTVWIYISPVVVLDLDGSHVEVIFFSKIKLYEIMTNPGLLR